MKLNLVPIEINLSSETEYFFRSFQDDDLSAMRNDLVGDGSIIRIGETIFGSKLNDEFLEKYGFTAAQKKLSDLDGRFVSNLIRDAINHRMVELDFEKVGHDKYQQKDEISFTIGDEKEIVAKTKWLIRPFTLPDNDHTQYSILINPRLAYRFQYSFAYLKQYSLNWSEFGDKLRAISHEQLVEGVSSWEYAHTVKVLNEEEDGLSLVCELRGEKTERIPLSYCWPLANTNNRYHYVKRRYIGSKGLEYSRQLKSRDDEFFSLQKIFPQIQNLISKIGSLQLDGIMTPLSGLSDVSIMQRQDIDALQAVDIAKHTAIPIIPEDFDDDNEPDEYVQLDLI